MDNRVKLKVLMAEKSVHQYEIAKHLGWAESKVSAMMRNPSDEEYELLSKAIEELKRKDNGKRVAKRSAIKKYIGKRNRDGRHIYKDIQKKP